MKVTVLGSGAFGCAIASMFINNNCDVRIWNKFDNGFEKLKKKLGNVSFYTDMKRCIDSDTFIVVAIPIEYMESVITLLAKEYNSQDILIVSKGIDANTGLFASDILNKYINPKNIGVISGGTFAIDMINKNIMGLTLATNSDSVKDKVMNYLDNEYLNIEYINDIIAVQVCGAIKNVMAIGHGILDGANLPDSSRFLFLTEAIYEIKGIIKFLGGDSNNIISYAGIDDIMMTCTSSKSRNYCLGRIIGENKSVEEIDKYKSENTIEGFTTLAGIKILLGRDINKFKICNTLYEILYNNKDYSELINILKK